MDGGGKETSHCTTARSAGRPSYVVNVITWPPFLDLRVGAFAGVQDRISYSKISLSFVSMSSKDGKWWRQNLTLVLILHRQRFACR